MSKASKTQPVSLRILGKDYRIACPEKEQDALLSSAQELDRQMREIRDSGTVIGVDKIAVMAALNLTHELNLVKDDKLKKTPKSKDNISSKLANLSHKIENVLESL
ncbi:MAG: cell division protein ZapA [Methylococcales bacterium]|nr:cell division protein ZapA [Methylococcales bacterium]